MVFNDDAIRRTWEETARKARFHPYPEADDDGLVYGVGTVLAARKPRAAQFYSPRGDDARAFVLLSIAAGRPAQVDTLRFLRRALDQWDRGEKALAQFELAFARFPRLRTRDDGWPLFWADTLITGGMSTAMLLQKFGLASDASLLRYAVDEPRVPAGHGRQSGEWTTGDYGARPHPAGRDYAQNSRGPRTEAISAGRLRRRRACWGRGCKRGTSPGHE